MAVVTHNSAADLKRFLAGQVELARDLDTILIVVDNGSTDASLGLVRGFGSAVKVILSARNRGYAAAVNDAAAAVPDRDLLLLNPDVRAPTKGAVKTLVRQLADRSRAAVVAPRQVDDEGRVQPSARRFPSLVAMLGSLSVAGRFGALRRRYDDYLSPSWAEADTRVDWVNGAAMLIRREAFDAVGGWDERFFLYMEDADFCRRCVRAGWEIWLVPSVEVQHAYARASTTNASLVASSARRRHVSSLARFFAREPRLLIGRGRG